MARGSWQEFAVFSRNHEMHLGEAAAAGPGTRRTFRSKSRWVAAAKALDSAGKRKIYFATNGGGSAVLYEADLVDIEVDPIPDSDRTRELLAYSGPTTEQEGLWGGEVQTLYVVEGCRRLDQPFDMSELKLHAGDGHLSGEFRYGYSCVKAR